MKSELKIKNFLKAINEFLTPEQQPCGVQVVEWVGLVPFSFQFFTRLAAIVENQWRRHYWQHWEATSG